MVSHVRPSKRGRATERGTTLFVVVLAITMLTGIGLYTVHSAALLARAAGNEREATQTEYLAQLGVLSSLAQVSTAPQSYIFDARNLNNDSNIANANQLCRQNLGIDLTIYAAPSCWKFDSSGTGGLTPLASHSVFTPDSFGTATPAGTFVLGGSFYTELTDVYSLTIPPPGMAAWGTPKFTFYEAKLTTTAQIQPASVTADCVQDVAQVAGEHSTRAHVLIGPVSE